MKLLDAPHIGGLTARTCPFSPAKALQASGRVLAAGHAVAAGPTPTYAEGSYRRTAARFREFTANRADLRALGPGRASPAGSCISAWTFAGNGRECYPQSLAANRVARAARSGAAPWGIPGQRPGQDPHLGPAAARDRVGKVPGPVDSPGARGGHPVRQMGSAKKPGRGPMWLLAGAEISSSRAMVGAIRVTGSAWGER